MPGHKRLLLPEPQLPHLMYLKFMNDAVFVLSPESCILDHWGKATYQSLPYTEKLDRPGFPLNGGIVGAKTTGCRGGRTPADTPGQPFLEKRHRGIGYVLRYLVVLLLLIIDAGYKAPSAEKAARKKRDCVAIFPAAVRAPLAQVVLFLAKASDKPSAPEIDLRGGFFDTGLDDALKQKLFLHNISPDVHESVSKQFLAVPYFGAVVKACNLSGIESTSLDDVQQGITRRVVPDNFLVVK